MESTHHAPFLDLYFRDVLDGDLEVVTFPDSGIDDAEASLAKHLSNFVGLLEGLRVR